MGRSLAAPIIVWVSVLSASAAHAQTASSRVGVTLGAGAIYGNLTGGDFTGTEAAIGFDANLGVVLGRWQLGVGYDRTSHGREDTDGDYIVSNIYVEPRVMFGTPFRRLTPYAALRLGRAMATYEGVLGIADDATGYVAGFGAGVLWSVASHVQADAAAHYARLSHDYGTGGYADAEKGGRASVRLGVRLDSSRRRQPRSRR
jgi:hypothetical protein